MDELAELAAPIGTAAMPGLPARGRCLWAIGEIDAAGFRWCGAKAAPGRPYCPDHVPDAVAVAGRALILQVVDPAAPMILRRATRAVKEGGGAKRWSTCC